MAVGSTFVFLETVSRPTFVANWLFNEYSFEQTLASPSFTIGLQSNNLELDITLPQPILSAYANDWSLNVTLPQPTVVFSSLEGCFFTVNSTLKRPTIKTSTINGQLLSLSTTISSPSIVFSCVQTVYYTLDKTLNRPVLTTSLLVSGGYSLNKEIVRPTITAVWRNLAINQTSGKTYVLNLMNSAHTEYTNYGFNSYFKFNNTYYGINSTGIFRLTGSLDNTDDINCEVHTPVSSFDKQGMKACSDAIIFGRIDGDIEIIPVMDEEEVREGIYLRADNKQGLHRHRVKIPKGLKGSTWQFKIKNYNGSNFAINNLEVFLRELQRIR